MNSTLTKYRHMVINNRNTTAVMVLALMLIRKYLAIESGIEVQFWFAVGAARNVIYGLFLAIIRRFITDGPMYNNSKIHWDLRVHSFRQVVEWGQHALYDDSRRYTAVRAIAEKLALPVYYLLAYLGPCKKISVQVPELFSGNKNINIDCDVWAKKNKMEMVKLIIRQPSNVVVNGNPRGNEREFDDGHSIWFVYLHGGGYAMGGLMTACAFANTLFQHLDFPEPYYPVVMTVDYALAPEQRYPRAIDDAISVMHWLSERIDNKRVCLIGDSAGGGLIASTCFGMLHHPRYAKPFHSPKLQHDNQKESSKDKLPGACVLISPMLDQRHDKSYCSKLNYTDIISEKLAQGTSRNWCDAHEAHEPLASPILFTQDHIKDFPPCLLQYGSHEIFSHDIEFLASKMTQVNSKHVLDKYENMVHVFQIIGRDIDETKIALKKARDFAMMHCVDSTIKDQLY